MPAPTMKHILESDTPALGFQIAPMIDVVFVIMLFFMVMVGSMKVERQLSLQLPRVHQEGLRRPFPDNEVTIAIREDGTVAMNDQEFDSAASKELPVLTSTLVRLSKSSTWQQQEVLVTLETEELASYERIIDVLNALHKAQITHVTFSVGADTF